MTQTTLKVRSAHFLWLRDSFDFSVAARFRRGKALKELGRLSEAKEDLLVAAQKQAGKPSFMSAIKLPQFFSFASSYKEAEK